MKRPLILLIILFLIVMAETVFLFIKHDFTKSENRIITASKNVFNLSENSQLWAERILKVGGKKAYQDFKKEVENIRPGIQHAKSHEFGEALYYSEGLDGISVCDNSFSFGCYHSFLGTAIYLEDLKTIPFLNQKCIENLRNQALGCQHGIGHGIMTYLGYRFENLTNALINCDKLTANDPIGGCIGGVFMEYNFQTMLVDEGKIRTYDKKKPYYPCDLIGEKFRPACYFWQGQWWSTVLSENNEEKYHEIGDLCQQIVSDSFRDQCFLGIGNITPILADWNPKQAIILCKIFSSLEEQLLCQAGAAGSFAAVPEFRDLSSELCDEFKGEDKDKCRKFALLSVGNVQK